MIYMYIYIQNKSTHNIFLQYQLVVTRILNLRQSFIMYCTLSARLSRPEYFIRELPITRYMSLLSIFHFLVVTT